MIVGGSTNLTYESSAGIPLSQTRAELPIQFSNQQQRLMPNESSIISPPFSTQNIH